MSTVAPVFRNYKNRKSTRRPIVYYAFDLLHWNGTDLLNFSFNQRREMLEDVGSRFAGQLKLNPVSLTPHLREQVYEEVSSLMSFCKPAGTQPLRTRLDRGEMHECVWLKPERRYELEFVERTRGERLRHAAFRRLVG